jgi:glycine cleavage system H protein|tara:strand:+ start:1993 stop:2421 length:429 start_codon:yes stop_codon:yes gene_type:complete
MPLFRPLNAKGNIMSNLPANLRYAASHEWVLDNQDGTVTVGITDHAQEALGDVVFVELPEVGQALNKGKEFGVIESVKAASDLYSPVDGEVVEVNEALEDAPETVNDAPYEGGWIMKVRVTDQALEGLLDADAYQATLSNDD